MTNLGLQVPYVLQSDVTLTPAAVNVGTMLWHLGILCAVLGIGRLMDAASMPKRGVLIGGPMAVNAALFAAMTFYGVGGVSRFNSQTTLPNCTPACSPAPAPAPVLALALALVLTPCR